jgi:predicted nucleotidyltransferase component of viral defense system
MISFAYINEWRDAAPWDTQVMVEQDLIISRIVIELFSDPFLRDALIFRGGTALNKLCFPRPLRYSEDVDLVQREAGPIGPVFDAVRRAMGDWLGEKPARKQGPGVVNLIYRVLSEDVPPLPLRIKIEINTREHFRVLPIVERGLRVESRWFTGEARIPVYATEELLGTKLRALYQRRKGRDLFDLAAALRELSPDAAAIVDAFQRYMAEEGRRVTGDEFRVNLAAKLDHPGFAEDCAPLLKPGTVFDPAADARLLEERLLSLLPNPKGPADQRIPADKRPQP